MILSYWIALQIACNPIICIRCHNIIIKKTYSVNIQNFFCLIHYVIRHEKVRYIFFGLIDSEYTFFERLYESSFLGKPCRKFKI